MNVPDGCSHGPTAGFAHEDGWMSLLAHSRVLLISLAMFLLATSQAMRSLENEACLPYTIGTRPVLERHSGSKCGYYFDPSLAAMDEAWLTGAQCRRWHVKLPAAWRHGPLGGRPPCLHVSPIIFSRAPKNTVSNLVFLSF